MPRDAILVLPANRARMVQKSTTSGAQTVVLDLEDAVAPADKAYARSGVGDAIRLLRPSVPCVGVRVNGVRSAEGEADLEALADLNQGPDFVVLPKAESSADFDAAAVRAPGFEFHALIESARGLVNIADIASHDRCVALVLGYADLAVSLGRPPHSELDPLSWAHAQDTVVLYARAAGILAVDGPFLGLNDDDAIMAAARVGRGRGFDAKWAVHPRQLPLINAAFRPTTSERQWARQTIARLAEAEAGGAGSASDDGLMIDEAVRKAALRILERADEDPT